MKHSIEIEEDARQLTLLGLAILSIDRPGFEKACREASKMLGGELIFESFREANGDRFAHLTRTVTPDVERFLIELVGLKDQIEKRHFLNVHFRAFRLAYSAWQEHIRANAISGSRAANSPGGAVLDDERDDVRGGSR